MYDYACEFRGCYESLHGVCAGVINAISLHYVDVVGGANALSKKCGERLRNSILTASFQRVRCDEGNVSPEPPDLPR